MQTISRIHILKEHLKKDSRSGKSIGFVPTMGALHQGHASLIQKSLLENDKTVVSIFVNPTQFGPDEDFDAYPRTLGQDSEMLIELGVDYLFAPEVKDMYPFGPSEILFSLKGMDQKLCGAKRPGHFNGVLLVVNKLLNIVCPDRAYFGRKDYQQFTILKRMAEELFMHTEVVPCPIIREADGLAMSSRNRYLSKPERKQSLFLSKTLQIVKEKLISGAGISEVEAVVKESAQSYPDIRLDYFELCDGKTLEFLDSADKERNPVALIAAYCGTTRLIDNLEIYI